MFDAKAGLAWGQMKRVRLREVYACRKCRECHGDGVDATRNHPGPTLPLHLRGRDRHATSLGMMRRA